MNVSGCVRVTDIAVNTLFLGCTQLHTLGLRKCTDISDEAFQVLSPSVGHCLRHLDVSGCPRITDTAITKFGQFCSHLEVLRISGKGISDAGLRAVLGSWERLCEFMVEEGENVGDEVVRMLGSKCRMLHHLEISSGKNISSGAFSLDNEMNDETTPLPPTWHKLQHLNISKCPNVNDVTLFSIIPSSSPTLTISLFSLNLAFCDLLTDRSILHIAAHCPYLIDLNITNCKNVTDVSLVELTRRCSMQKLVLTNCGEVTDATLLSIASHCPGLLHLDLSLCEKVTDQGILKISQGCIQLRSLSLEECHITDAAILTLASTIDGLGYGCYYLETVKLAYCKNVTDAALTKLAKGCPNVLTLDLSYCGDSITVDGLRESLKCWTKLETLRLKGYPISSESIIDGVHPSLKVLNLSWCRNIEDDALVKISNTCPSLEDCDIARCTKITNTGVQELAAKCSNLRQLNVTGCKDVSPTLIQNLVNNFGKMIYR